GNMEEGSMRCDANVSLRAHGATALGTKVEIKNLNSFRHVQHALEFEVRRQAKALQSGERIVQETRLWDADRGSTRAMRSKEFAHDYRYFPEPDLVPLKLDAGFVDGIRRALPVLPRRLLQRFFGQFGLPAYAAGLLTDTGALGAVGDQVIAANPKAVADWKAGKTAAAKALVGQVMKATQGKASPTVVNRLLDEKLATL